MDYKKACDLLDLQYDYKKGDIKRAYYKKAIQFHPDKNPDGEEMFKKVNDAYIFLQNGVDTDMKRENMKYMDFIRKIISPECEWNELFISTTIKNILVDCEKGAIKVFQHLKKENAIKMYHFVCKYSDILYISDEILLEMKNILKTKMKDDNIIILNPRLDDLLHDKIYRLEVEDHTFYIPLWHNEVCYDISGNDLIVKCIPELVPDITIDNYNNIHYKMNISIQKLFDDKEIVIQMADKKWTIPSSHFKIVDIQTYILRKEGMLKINDTNIYDDVDRGHIYVEIHLS